MYFAAENRKSARRKALASAVNSICDDLESTLVITVVGTHEVSKEESEILMQDWAHARTQAEIDADDSPED